MKVLFIGMGSIGTRHLKNLYKISRMFNFDLVVHAFKSGKSNYTYDVSEYNIKEIYDYKLLDDKYDVIFVANPTNLHFSTMKEFRRKTECMFVEKPVFENIDYPIESFLQDNVNYYVAAPIRYTNVFKKVKELVKGEKINSVRIICSSYMPNWQKNRDYKKSFRTSTINGGGVDIDLIHEIDYMVELFGYPSSVYRNSKKVSNLEMEACDLAVYVFDYEDFTVEVHLDYFGFKDNRKIEIITDNNYIVGDFIEKQVFNYKQSEMYKVEQNDQYLDEMASFYQMYVKKSNSTNDIKKAFKCLALAKGEII